MKKLILKIRNSKFLKLALKSLSLLSIVLVLTIVFLIHDLKSNFPTRSNLPNQAAEQAAFERQGDVVVTTDAVNRTHFRDVGFQKHLDFFTGTGLTLNREIHVWQNGDSKTPLAKVVENSRGFLFVNMLSIACDSSTEPLVMKMSQKARAGTDVRVLVNKGYALISRACLDRLESSGVEVRKGRVHASYLVNDNHELLIGSQSLNLFFLDSNGQNHRDRDLMLSLAGPAATDSVISFLQDWGDESGASPSTRKEDERDQRARAWVKSSVEDEIQQGRRGEANYEKWLKNPADGLCRFAAQSPARSRDQIGELLQRMTRSSSESIELSGITIDAAAIDASGEKACDGPLARLICDLKERDQAGVMITVLTNSRHSGNGELTMLLEEWLAAPGLSDFTKRPLSWFRDWDADRAYRKNFDLVSPLAKLPNTTIWQSSQFIHYKSWLFDHEALWIGSANPDQSSMLSLHEAGVLCLQPELVRAFQIGWAMDRRNSAEFDDDRSSEASRD